MNERFFPILKTLSPPCLHGGFFICYRDAPWTEEGPSYSGHPRPQGVDFVFRRAQRASTAGFGLVFRAAYESSDHSIIPHDPGMPPQRPHMGASELAEDFPVDSPPTAKRLSVRAVLGEPHSGQTGLCSPVIVRTSWSNFLLQAWQEYS